MQLCWLVLVLRGHGLLHRDVQDPAQLDHRALLHLRVGLWLAGTTRHASFLHQRMVTASSVAVGGPWAEAYVPLFEEEEITGMQLLRGIAARAVWQTATRS